jgi:hypothetical protein
VTAVINQEIIALSINIGEQHVTFAYVFNTKEKKKNPRRIEFQPAQTGPNVRKRNNQSKTNERSSESASVSLSPPVLHLNTAPTEQKLPPQKKTKTQDTPPCVTQTGRL